MRQKQWLYGLAAALLVPACSDSNNNGNGSSSGGGNNTDLCDGIDNCIGISASENATQELQSALQEAGLTGSSDTVIELDSGVFTLTSGLSAANADGLTIRGQGRAETILNFADMATGSGTAGLLIQASNDVVVEDLSIEDARGDNLRIESSMNVIVRNVRSEWTNGPDEDNGRYGIYPVDCDNVLVEDVEARGASDAGIYVGESRTVNVRNSNAWENVAGIQIENTLDSEVYNNTATNNTAGFMIFDLPGKQNQKNGGRHLVYNNLSENNNEPNFGAPGAIVTELPAGLGALIMATENVEFRNNIIRNHRTVHLAITSFFITGEDPSTDPEFFPFPVTVYAHDNEFSGVADNPDVTKDAGQLLLALNENNGDIMFDGIVTAPVDGTPDPDVNPQFICIQNNIDQDGDAEFIDLDAGALDFSDPFGTIDQPTPSTDPTPFDCAGPTQAEVELPFDTNGGAAQ